MEIHNKKHINIDQLLLYSLSKLINENKQATFENIVVECFKLFPQEFGLKGFTDKYPDSSRIDKTWRRCRTDRKWISGSVAHGFSITPKGTEELEKIMKVLESKGGKDNENNDNVQHGDKRTKSGRIVEHIEKHAAFLKFLKDNKSPNITDHEICDLLFSTLDAFPSTRKKNLIEMKNLVFVYQRKDIINFLNWIEENKKYLF